MVRCSKDEVIFSRCAVCRAATAELRFMIRPRDKAALPLVGIRRVDDNFFSPPFLVHANFKAVLLRYCFQMGRYLEAPVLGGFCSARSTWPMRVAD